MWWFHAIPTVSLHGVAQCCACAHTNSPNILDSCKSLCFTQAEEWLLHMYGRVRISPCWKEILPVILPNWCCASNFKVSRVLSPSQLSMTAPLCAGAVVSISTVLHVPPALQCWPCSVPFAMDICLFVVKHIPSTCQGLAGGTKKHILTAPLGLQRVSSLHFSLNQVSVDLLAFCSAAGWMSQIQNKFFCPAWWGSTSPSLVSLLPFWGN